MEINLKLGHQTEEEIGSAEEQPISNRFDEYTIIERVVMSHPFSIIGTLIWLKKTYFEF